MICVTSAHMIQAGMLPSPVAVIFAHCVLQMCRAAMRLLPYLCMVVL